MHLDMEDQRTPWVCEVQSVVDHLVPEVAPIPRIGSAIDVRRRRGPLPDFMLASPFHRPDAMSFRDTLLVPSAHLGKEA